MNGHPIRPWATRLPIFDRLYLLSPESRIDVTRRGFDAAPCALQVTK